MGICARSRSTGPAGCASPGDPPSSLGGPMGEPSSEAEAEGPRVGGRWPITPRGRPKLHGYCPTASLTGASLRERRGVSGA